MIALLSTIASQEIILIPFFYVAYIITPTFLVFALISDRLFILSEESFLLSEEKLLCNDDYERWRH